MSPLHGRIIDAWMQHPTARFRAQPMFDSLLRWFPAANLASEGEVPFAATIEAMDAGGVRLGLVCAWWGPRGPLIDNDEVAAFIREYPDRLVQSAAIPQGTRGLHACARPAKGSSLILITLHGQRGTALNIWIA